MINLIVIAISAIMLALLLVWWRWEAFRVWIEAPKYSMLRQERWFDTGLGKTLNHHGVEDIDTVHSSSLRRKLAVEENE
jgi:hypothetical protein